MYRLFSYTAIIEYATLKKKKVLLLDKSLKFALRSIDIIGYVDLNIGNLKAPLDVLI